MVKRAGGSEDRFEEYVERLGAVLGHADRREPLRAYLVGLCLPGERKSIEPMAARVDPRHVRARHQSLHHFVAVSGSQKPRDFDGSVDRGEGWAGPLAFVLAKDLSLAAR
jgi:SRSO17 transposase